MSQVNQMNALTGGTAKRTFDRVATYAAQKVSKEGCFQQTYLPHLCLLSRNHLSEKLQFPIGSVYSAWTM